MRVDDQTFSRFYGIMSMVLGTGLDMHTDVGTVKVCMRIIIREGKGRRASLRLLVAGSCEEGLVSACSLRVGGGKNILGKLRCWMAVKGDRLL